MTPDQLEDVRADIYAEPWKDPQLFPDLLHKAITEIGKVATGQLDEFEREDRPDEWAAKLLREMQERARRGVPFGEPVYGDLGPTNPKDV